VLTTLHQLVLDECDDAVGLDLEVVSTDGCLNQAPGGGAGAGRSPVDRGKLGYNFQLLVDGRGAPLAVSTDVAGRPDSKIVGSVLEVLTCLKVPRWCSVALDKAHDSRPVRDLVGALGLEEGITRKGSGVSAINRLTGGGWRGATAS
jgi:hypothetical protein